MAKANPPLDGKGEKLMKEVQTLLDAMLSANTGTSLSVAHPRVLAAIDALAKYRYAQIGAMEPQATKR
jgi:hypothetical protein